MVLWGFLAWFGTVGDSGGGTPGFFSGTGATGIALVLAASALTLHQILEGRPHSAASPPVAAFLGASASILILGGMIAKPESSTLAAGAVAGLLTALSQGVVLVLGWLRGSGKIVKASNIRALEAQQAAADQAAALAANRQQYGQQPYGQQIPGQPFGQPPYGQPSYGQPPYGQPPYQQGQWPPPR